VACAHRIMRQLAWRRKHREVRRRSCLRDNRKKIIGIVGTRILFGGIFASLPRVKHLASCTNLAPALFANNYSSSRIISTLELFSKCAISVDLYVLALESKVRTGCSSPVAGSELQAISVIYQCCPVTQKLAKRPDALY
jgi:hypothetical protein